MKKNIGIIISFRPNKWLGGFNYFVNFCNLLDKKKFNLIIFCSNRERKICTKNFKKEKILITEKFVYPKKYLGVKSKLKMLVFGKDRNLNDFLKKYKIDFLFGNFLGKKSDIVSIPIIWDFQEITNPQNFTFIQNFMRKFNNYMCKNNSDITFVSTKTDFQTFNKYYNKNRKRNSIYINMPETLKNFKLINKKKLMKKYKIKRNFFIVPNQYWKHKNHILLLEALKNLNHVKKKNILIISTGQKKDWRHKINFYNIKKYLNKNNLQENYKILGIISKNDLLNLIYYSIALINPSKSEGESGAVEMATAFGKLTLLSNIKTHIEQKKIKSFFFGVNDYKKLSQLLIKFNEKFNSKQNVISNKKYLKIHRNYIKAQEIKFTKLFEKSYR